MSVRVEVLGGLRVFRDGEEVVALLRKPVQCALLVYLAVERSATKDELQAVLWPEKPTSKARGSLNNTMYELRSTLGSWAGLHGDEFRTADWVSTDVADLRDAVANGTVPERAPELLGACLEGVHLTSSGEFERWAEDLRASLARQQERLERSIVLARYEVGELDEALRRARMWADRRPMDDEAQYWAIRLEAETGHRSDAMDRFARFSEALKSRHGVEPSEEIGTLVAGIQRGETRSALEAGLVDIRPGPRTAPVARSSTPPTAWRPDDRSRSRLLKLLGGYIASSWVVLQVISLLLDRYERLTQSFFDAALVLAICGLPIVVATAFLQSRPVSGESLSGLRFLLARWFSWRNTALGGVAAASAWSAAAIGWLLVGPGSGPVLNPDRIVVFPMVTSGSAEPAEGVDVALAIGAALEHTEPLRFVDGWRLLDPEQRQDIAAITPTIAGGLSRQSQAGSYIEGVLWTTGDSLSLTLRLIDVASDSLVTQQTEHGHRESATFPGLALSAVLPLLPHIAREGTAIDLSSIADRSVASTALWLQGERSYRGGRFVEARDFFERAVSEDSLHVFAALRGAQAADYATDYPTAGNLLRSALANQARLPPRYRALALGLDAYQRGEADTSLDHLRRALELDPSWPEAAMAIGEVYFHLLPSDASRPDSLAEYWLRRAYSADTTFLPPLFHLSELALRGPAPAAAAPFVTVWTRSDPEPVLLRQIELAARCVEGDDVEWAALLPEESRAVLQAGEVLADGLHGEACAHAAFRAVFESDVNDNIRWTALKGLLGLEMARGRHERARALLAEGLGSGISATRTLYVYATLAGAPFAREAAGAEERLRRASGDTYETLPRWRWLMGAWLWYIGDTERLHALAEDFLADAEESGERRALMLAQALDARSTLARGDTAAAVAKLTRLAPTGRPIDIKYVESEGLAADRLLLAELHLARGDFEAARQTASLLDHAAPIMYPVFLLRSLEIRRDAAAALGKEQDARDFADRIAQLTSVSEDS